MPTYLLWPFVFQEIENNQESSIDRDWKWVHVDGDAVCNNITVLNVILLDVPLQTFRDLFDADIKCYTIKNKHVFFHIINSLRQQNADSVIHLFSTRQLA